jgi:hypothetical protein
VSSPPSIASFQNVKKRRLGYGDLVATAARVLDVTTTLRDNEEFPAAPAFLPTAYVEVHLAGSAALHRV